MSEVNLVKRDSLKKNIIKAGIIGVGVLGLSGLANASTMFRSNTKDYEIDNVASASIGIVIDNQGNAIETGLQNFKLRVPCNCTLKSWTIMSDVSGSIVIDIWKDTYGNYPPTNADSITNGNEPTLTTSTKSEGTDLSGWTSTDLNEGDILFFNVDSASTLTTITLIMKVIKHD